MSEEKKKIIEHYEKSIKWVKSLEVLNEDTWRTQIDAGKWTIAEVIGHLIPWDTFVLNQRLPYLLTTAPLPISPAADVINRHSSAESRNRSKEETIHLFIATRKKLITELEHLSDEEWEKEFVIKDNKIALYDYLSGLVEHDLHHFRQVQKVLRSAVWIC